MIDKYRIAVPTDASVPRKRWEHRQEDTHAR